MILCAIMGFTNTAQAYDYRAKFIQECGWLATQQITSGGDLGGIWEGEDYTDVIQTDNTQEAIWIWSRYAELTGDYTTYQTKIDNAWTYCIKYPAWLEGGALATPLNYYSTYNIGWGLLAEMKYRQVYQGRAGYVNHSSYATSCADALVSYTPSTTDTTGVLVTGIAAGALYQYGVDISSTTYKNRAVVLGGNVRTWLNGNTSRFASESWAVSGGMAVWGVLNSYYKDPANASGAAAWATTANTNMPINAADGSNNDYEYGHDGWYGWGHYAISQTLASGTSFQNYRNVVDTILASDGDSDGGIRQGTTYTDSQDYAWSTDIMQFASNYGLISTQYYTISGTVTYNGSPLAGVTMDGLPGATVPVTDANGFYTAQVPSGFYCTVTPTKTGYVLTPVSISYNNVTSNQTAQNYTAVSIPASGTVTTNTSSSARTSATFSHTVAVGDNRLLAVSVMLRGNITVSSVTYGGAALTKAISRASGASSGCTTEIWYMVAPPVGTASVVVTFSASADPSAIAAVNFTGVNQTSPVGATASNLATTGTGITTNITTLNANSLIFGAATNYGGDTDPFTPGANITELWDNATGTNSGSDNGEWGGKLVAATAGTYTFKTTSSVSDDLTIAAVELKTVPVVLPPGKAASPSPSSGTTGIGVTTDLSWAAGSGATSHLVYFGTASPGAYQGEQTGNTFDTGTLANGTTYYWRIDEKNAGGTTAGDVWNFTTIVRRTLTSSSTTGGDVTTPGEGAFQYDNGTNAGIVASANANYHFVNWTGTAVTAGKVANPTSASTTVQMDGDYTVVANFAINQRSLLTSATLGGSVGTPGIGTYWYDHGANASIVASPTAGWYFVNWTGTAVTAGKVASPTSAGTTVLMDANYTVQANFGINQYSITATAGANGSISPSGTFSKDYGSSQLFTATPAAGYDVDTWFVDGGSVQTGGTTYTLSSITATHTVNVTFKIQTFSITGTAGANGSISPSGTFSKDYGSSQLFTATPAAGYEVDKWTLDGSNIQTGGNTYTLSTITATHTVHVTFKIMTFTLTYSAGANGTISGTTPQTVDYNASGTAVTAVPATGYHFVKWSDESTANPRTDTGVTANITVSAAFSIDTFTVTASASANGSIGPNGDITKDYGSSQLFTATPATGYEVDKWTLDGSDIQTGGNTYTLSTITATHAIAVSFKITTYTVTGTAGTNGSIDPSGDITKDYDSTQCFTATPNTGYDIDTWYLDGDSVQTGGGYCLNNIAANHTVNVTFKMQTFAVTASAVANGSIDPLSAAVNYNGSQLFTATPDTGYEVNEWFVDGSGVQTAESTYTLENITANHTVTVTFSRMVLSIAGYVVEPDSITPVKDVLMSAGDFNTLTDANGYYELSVDWGWSGVVTPGKEGYVFEPVSSTYDNIAQSYSDANYTATLTTFKIAGYVLDSGNSSPISNASVSAENGGGPWTSKYGGGSAMTDAAGYYEVMVDYNWSGKVTPAKYAYAFEPNGTSYENVKADTTGQNYAGTLLTFKISGHIKNECNVPIAGVMVSADNGGGQAMTDATGFYEVWVSYAWSGTVTPEKLHYTFNPVGLTYTGVLADQPGQNYAANNIYDLDCDGSIDLGDVAVLCDSWLITGSPIPGDFDADGTVDFVNYAVFGSVWGD